MIEEGVVDRQATKMLIKSKNRLKMAEQMNMSE